MQNLLYHDIGYWRRRLTNAQGVVSFSQEQTANVHKKRVQSGYTGPRPNPLVPHGYSFNWQDYNLAGWSNYAYADGSVDFYEGGILHPTSVAGVIFEPTYPHIAELTARALSNLNDNSRGDLDLSIDIAEAGQTRRMLDATRSVEDYTRTFTRRFGALKTVGSLWLQYTYGVKPLVNSVFKAAEESARTVLNKMERHTGRATDYYVPKSIQIPTLWGPISFPVVGGRHKVSVTFGVDLRSSEWDPARWSSLNPASIAWELLPYSFVADWFINVGGYLRNLETAALYASRFRSGYKTILSAGDESVELVNKSAPGANPFNTARYQGRVKTIDIQRTVLSTYPAPTLPSFRARLGSSRLLSAASLLTTLLSSGGNPKHLDKGLQKAVQSGANRNVSRSQPKPNVSVWEQGYGHL